MYPIGAMVVFRQKMAYGIILDFQSYYNIFLRKSQGEFLRAQRAWRIAQRAWGVARWGNWIGGNVWV